MTRRVKTKTRPIDVFVGQVQLCVRSPLSWSLSVLSGVAVAVHVVEQFRFMGGGLILVTGYVAFVTGAVSVWLVHIPGSLLNVLVNFFVKGAYGEKTYSLGREGIALRSEKHEEVVSWHQVSKVWIGAGRMFIKHHSSRMAVIPLSHFETSEEAARFYSEAAFAIEGH